MEFLLHIILLPNFSIEQIVQSVIGSLLYYTRAVDPTFLPTLNQLSTEQANPTTKNLKKIQKLLDFAATYPNAILRFHASDMVLHVDSDAAYHVMPGTRSRITGHFQSALIQNCYHLVNCHL